MANDSSVRTSDTRMENTICVCWAVLTIGIAFLAALNIGTSRAAEAQATLPPAPLRPDAEMGPMRISVANMGLGYLEN